MLNIYYIYKICYNYYGDSMRLRNIPGAVEKVDSSLYVVKDYENYKGKFKSLFKNDNEVHLEIGTGKGDFIIGMAKKYPNINFISIEKYQSVLVRALEKIDIDIPNLKFICEDASKLENMFDKEINTIYLNFSDPWPKARHEKRRLTSLVFLKLYDKVFKNDKTIIMKTDNRHLFEYSIKSFTDYDYKIEYVCLDLHQEDTISNVETEYEKKFKKLGPIYKIIVKKG